MKKLSKQLSTYLAAVLLCSNVLADTIDKDAVDAIISGYAGQDVPVTFKEFLLCPHTSMWRMVSWR